MMLPRKRLTTEGSELYRAGSCSYPVSPSTPCGERLCGTPVVGYFYFAYNFIKIHRTLRTSPAMAAGVTRSTVECGRFGRPVGSLRAAEGGKSGSVIPTIYVAWLVLLALYFLQGAVTGALRKRRGRSANAVWLIPSWARLLCLLISSGFAVAAVLYLLEFQSSPLPAHPVH